MLCVFYISAKKGTCPVPSDDISSCVKSRHECSIDHDCDEDMKCCQQSCGRVCVEPDIQGMSTYLTTLFIRPHWRYKLDPTDYYKRSSVIQRQSPYPGLLEKVDLRSCLQMHRALPPLPLFITPAM